MRRSPFAVAFLAVHLVTRAALAQEGGPDAGFEDGGTVTPATAASAVTDAGVEPAEPPPAAPPPLPSTTAAPPARVADAGAEEKGSKIRVTAAPGKGATIETLDERFSLTIRGRVQLRETLVVTDAVTNEINVKTLRLYFMGNVLDRNTKYVVQLALGGNDFDRDSASPIFDAYVESTHIRDANIRVGQFFVPFGRARTIREFGLQFVERPIVVSEFGLDRDVGIMVSSTDLFGTHGVLAYNLGVFGGEGKNRFGSTTPFGLLYVARATLRPFGAFDDDLEGDLSRSKKLRAALGVSGAYNHDSVRQRSSAGNNLTFGDLDYEHAAVDLVMKWRGASFLGEITTRGGSGPLQGVDASGRPALEWSRNGSGYLVQLGQMLTDRVEVVGRWDTLFARGPTDPQFTRLAAEGHELAGGANLYLNGHAFKIQADYSRIFGDRWLDGRSIARAQLDMTF